MNRINEKLKREVLLVLLEGLCILLKGDFSESSFDKAQRVWKKILYDFSTLFSLEPKVLELLSAPPKVYRIGRRYDTSGYKKRFIRAVPFIRLSGMWLETHGFDMGKRFAVYGSRDQLILKRLSYHKHMSDNLGDWVND